MEKKYSMCSDPGSGVKARLIRHLLPPLRLKGHCFRSLGCGLLLFIPLFFICLVPATGSGWDLMESGINLILQGRFAPDPEVHFSQNEMTVTALCLSIPIAIWLTILMYRGKFDSFDFAPLQKKVTEEVKNGTFWIPASEDVDSKKVSMAEFIFRHEYAKALQNLMPLQKKVEEEIRNGTFRVPTPEDLQAGTLSRIEYDFRCQLAKDLQNSKPSPNEAQSD